MYLSQQINVDLTRADLDVLKRPSRVFNKLKSLFSGEMTPTEHRQAEVMLSVLQRVNVALRQIGFDNLVSISANDSVVYEDTRDTVDDLEKGHDAIVRGLSDFEVKRINSLELTVDGEKQRLRYLVHIRILRRPRAGISPVRIKVLGFLREFEQRPGESDDAFATRFNEQIQQQWVDAGVRQRKLDALAETFDAQILELRKELNSMFPARSDAEDRRKVFRSRPIQSRQIAADDRFAGIYGYLPLWYASFADEAAAGDLDDDVMFDENDSWEMEDTKNDSWSAGAAFGDGDGADGGDGGGCGSGCGGGCGS